MIFINLFGYTFNLHLTALLAIYYRLAANSNCGLKSPLERYNISKSLRVCLAAVVLQLKLFDKMIST